jgi:hypothetical protein
MIRTLNFAFLAITGLICLGLYRTAEEVRVAKADLRTTEAGIAREHQAMAVLGAEWARLTQPARIQALAERHLDLSDKPTLALSSLTALPNRLAPVQPNDPIRTAKATVTAPLNASIVAVGVQSGT